MTSLPTRSTSSARQPDPIPIALDMALSRALSVLDGEVLPEPLPELTRGALAQRRAALTRSLEPAGAKRTALVLASLARMAFRGQPTRDMEAALSKQDIDDLQDLPEWALDRVCRAYRLAEIGDGQWRPTAGMLRAEAMKRVEAVARERDKIARVLDARVPQLAGPQASPEQRKAVLEGLRGLAKKLSACVVGAAILAAPPPRAQAHDFWTNGEPVPAWVKTWCCGPSDVHRLNPAAVHITPEGYRIDGIKTLIPLSKAMPSPDGKYWAFFKDDDTNTEPTIYCFYAPMNGV